MTWDYNYTARMYELNLSTGRVCFHPSLDITNPNIVSLSFIYSKGKWTYDESVECNPKTGEYNVERKSWRSTSSGIIFGKPRNQRPIQLQRNRPKILAATGLPKGLEFLVKKVFESLSE